jgi:hypothetical protein
LGFFYGESGRITEWSVNLLNSVDTLSDNDLIEEIGGAFKHYCYVLADFNPLLARDIYNNATIEEVTEALISRKVFNKVSDG